MSTSSRRLIRLLRRAGCIWAVLSGCFLAAGIAAGQGGKEVAFVHPGLLHSSEDLNRMSNGVVAHLQPLAAGFEAFSNHPQSKWTYRLRGPFDEIGRNPGIHAVEFNSDAAAAYQCALMWKITG